ncbi:MAG TPA: 50S ribosomal protein L23 [Candidatus Angelobacter sp.]|nr:50S ribosomal protein L23 [Candidatus Angelobacter sp.]
MKTQINIFPRTTEKAYGQSKNNVYVFDAPVKANKQQIIAAIESQFKVKTVSIKTLIQTGKAIRFSKGKRAQPTTTYHQDLKKAYVTLVKGDSIKVFDEATTAENSDKKARPTKLSAKEEEK